MEFYWQWPASAGEWLAFASAVMTIVFGILLYFFPNWSLRVLRLQTAPDVPEALTEVRGTMAGFYLGVGILCVLLAQPLLYMALGASWAFTAFGRLTSMVFDGANTPFNWISLPVELALALAPLAFVFGYIA